MGNLNIRKGIHTYMEKKKTGARLRCRGGKSPAEGGRERETPSRRMSIRQIRSSATVMLWIYVS